MHSKLSDAAARCHGRRLRALATQSPIPAAIVAIVVLAAPYALFRVGGAVGAEIARSIAERRVAAALVLGLVLAAAVGGAAFAIAAPMRSALGDQIAAGPCSSVAAIVALTVVPVLIGALVVVPSLVAACVGLVGALPDTTVTGLALAAATVAAIPAGAVVAEGALAGARRDTRRTLAVAAGLAGWLAVGRACGSPSLGPLALEAAALAGRGSASLALGVSVGVGSVLAAAWIALAATRPEPRARRRTRRRRGRSRMPTHVAALVLLGRRGDVRLAAFGAAVFGLSGAALAAGSAAPAPAPFLLGTTTALLGSLLAPLLVGGVLMDGGWLWRTAPSRRARVGVAFTYASSLLVAIPVAAVGLLVAAVSGVRPATAGAVGALGIVGSCLALVAGALIPWRSAGAGDQLTTIGAFAAIAIAASLVVGIAAPRLVAVGVPDALVVLAICVTGGMAAVAALERGLGAAGR